MRRVVYWMGTSLDGFISDVDGDHSWGAPDAELFAYVLDELRHLDAFLLGRKLYETMVYREDADQQPDLSDDEREWAVRWQQLPKVVFSTSLSSVRGNTRLATGSLTDEIERLRTAPGTGDIGIGGPELAAQAAELGLIDEYRTRVHPVLLGAGMPYFPQDQRRVELRLDESRTFPSGVVCSRYSVVR